MMHTVKFLLLHFTYFALAALLVAAGFGVPIPEDVPLIFSGYLCQPQQSPLRYLAPKKAAPPGKVGPTAKKDRPAVPKAAPADADSRVPDPWLMMLAGMVGVVCGDSVLWYVGSRGIDSNNFIARHVRKILHSKRREKVEKYFKKHGNLTVFIGRFIPGIRALVFAMAGISGMSYARFVALDGGAALLSVPTFIFIGYHFAAKITMVFHELDKIKRYIYIALIPICIVAAVIYIIRWRRSRAAEAPG